MRSYQPEPFGGHGPIVLGPEALDRRVAGWPSRRPDGVVLSSQDAAGKEQVLGRRAPAHARSSVAEEPVALHRAAPNGGSHIRAVPRLDATLAGGSGGYQPRHGYVRRREGGSGWDGVVLWPDRRSWCSIPGPSRCLDPWGCVVSTGSGNRGTRAEDATGPRKSGGKKKYLATASRLSLSLLRQ